MQALRFNKAWRFNIHNDADVDHMIDGPAVMPSFSVHWLAQRNMGANGQLAMETAAHF
jgi:hypothetical protein